MPAFLGSWCPQCGSNVSVDEDGCCNSCGCSAVGQGADEAHATIADLRDRMRLCRRYICRDCGCAIVRIGDSRCEDCGKAGLLYAWTPAQASEGPYAAACVSVGLRALCGRRILEGCE